MPSKSKKQHNFMEAIAHNKAFAKKVGVPQSVGKDFAEADKGRKFGLGGGVGITRGGKGQINKQVTRAGSIYGEQKEVPNVNLNKYIGKKAGGKTMATKKKAVNPVAAMMAARAMQTPPPAAPAAPAAPMQAPAGMPQGGMKKGGLSKKHEGKEMKKMAKGGETMGPRTMSKDVEKGSNKMTKFGESAVQKRGNTKGKNLGDSGPMKKMASGGSTSSRADGIAQRGRTKTKYC
jgi:hypothetical protein